MNGITVTSKAGREDSIQRAARIRREVREEMRGGVTLIQSKGGRRLAAAVEWCESQDLPYMITAVPGKQYVLQVHIKGAFD